MEAKAETKPRFQKTAISWVPSGWTTEEFGQFVEKSKANHNADTESAYRCIELEHINQNSGTINGWLSSEGQKSTKNKFKENEVLFGKLRPYLRKFWLATFDGVCSSEVWVLRTKNDRVCTNEFLFRVVQSDKFIQISNVTSGTKMPRADWNYISNYPFLLPPLPEQKKIAEILSMWDDAIDKTQQLIDKLKLRKKGLAQQLLSGKKRLAGFVGEWEPQPFGDYFTERLDLNNEGLPLLSVGAKGVYPQSDSAKKDTSNTDKSKYKRICVGDIGYNTMRMWQGRSALSNLEGIVSPAYTILKPKTNASSLFFSYLFKLDSVVHKFYRNSQGMVADTLNCRFRDFAIIKVALPTSKDEQSAIASVLQTADKEIDLRQKYLEALQQQKKGLMQQLLTGKTRVTVNY